jgi:hypothetical protein
MNKSQTSSSGPVDVLCIYRVKDGKEGEFKKLLKKHGPALRDAGLSPPGAPTIWKSMTRDGKTVFVEMMQWKDASSSHAAHQMPEVMAVWEPMGNLTDGMEFLDLQSAGLGKP